MNLILSAAVIVFCYIAISSSLLPHITPRSVQFGVRLPREREKDPEIRAVESRYYLILFTGLPILFTAFFLSSIFFADSGLMFIGLAIEVVYTHIDYFLAFRFLHRYKVSHDWYDGVSEFTGTVFSDIGYARRAIAGAYFILPSLLIIVLAFLLGTLDYSIMPTLIPWSFSRDGAVMSFTSKTLESVFRFIFYQMGISGGFFLFGVVLTRTKHEIDVSRPYTTYEQQTRFKDFYRDVVYSFSSMFGITFLLASLRVWDYPSLLIPGMYIAVPLVLGVFVLALSTYTVGQMGTRIKIPGVAGEDTGENNLDDDREWKVGMFYFNRRDPSILVGRRFGIGWTLNFGNPRSWVLIASLLSIYILVATHFLFHFV